MQRIIGDLHEYRYGDDSSCDACGEKIAVWYGLVFRGTSFEPAEYVYLCVNCAGVDDA